MPDTDYIYVLGTDGNRRCRQNERDMSKGYLIPARHELHAMSLIQYSYFMKTRLSSSL